METKVDLNDVVGIERALEEAEEPGVEAALSVAEKLYRKIPQLRYQWDRAVTGVVKSILPGHHLAQRAIKKSVIDLVRR